jgi:predicted Zn-dependent protease
VKHVPRSPRDDVNHSSVHPLRELGVLLIGVGLGILVLIVVVGEAIDRIVPHVPASWETVLFPRVFSGEIDASVDPKRRARLARILARMATHWPENPYGLHLGIVDRDEPNAFALPGGNVLVTTGLIDEARSENELAFVLGHELGHFRNRDHLRGLSRGLVLTMLLASIVDEGAIEFLTVAETLALRRYSREQESDADRFGLGLLHREYGHVAGATDFFARMPEPTGRMQRGTSAYVSTHPLGTARVEAIEAMASEQEWSLEGRKRHFRTGSPRQPARTLPNAASRE